MNARTWDALKTTRVIVCGNEYTTLKLLGKVNLKIHITTNSQFEIHFKGGFASVYEVFNSEKEVFALKVVNLDDENNVK